MRQDEVLIEVLKLIEGKQYSDASSLINLHYPRVIMSKDKMLLYECSLLGFSNKLIRVSKQKQCDSTRKSFTVKEKDSIFMRDYYQCRYSGLKLFAPPVLAKCQFI